MLPNYVQNVQRKIYIALCLLVKLLILMTSLLDHTEGMKTLSVFVLNLLCVSLYAKNGSNAMDT